MSKEGGSQRGRTVNEDCTKDSTKGDEVMTFGVKVSLQKTEPEELSGKVVSCNAEEPQKRATQSDFTTGIIFLAQKRVKIDKTRETLARLQNFSKRKTHFVLKRKATKYTEKPLKTSAERLLFKRTTN